jgi:hypothetical protein
VTYVVGIDVGSGGDGGSVKCAGYAQIYRHSEGQARLGYGFAYCGVKKPRGVAHGWRQRSARGVRPPTFSEAVWTVTMLGSVVLEPSNHATDRAARYPRNGGGGALLGSILHGAESGVGGLLNDHIIIRVEADPIVGGPVLALVAFCLNATDAA